jgi:hypothetical protein
MPNDSGPGNGTPRAHPHLPSAAGLDGPEFRTAAEAGLESESATAHRVGAVLTAKVTIIGKVRIGARRRYRTGKDRS